MVQIRAPAQGVSRGDIIIFRCPRRAGRAPPAPLPSRSSSSASHSFISDPRSSSILIRLLSQKRRNVGSVEACRVRAARGRTTSAPDDRRRTIQMIVVDRVGGGAEAIGAGPFNDLLDDLQTRLTCLRGAAAQT